MKFPPWVNGTKNKAERASNRLRYIIGTLAAKHTGRQSIRGLADLIGTIDHSTLSFYIRKGAFTPTAAMKIIDALPPGEVTVDMLTNPLDIKSESSA